MNHTDQNGRIVVPVDGSEHSIHGLKEARRYAELSAPGCTPSRPGYPLMLSAYPVMEWNPGQDAAEILDNALATAFGQDGPADIGKTVAQGQPAHALLEASRGAELLVVGCRGKGGFSGLLLGSVSSAVAAHAHCCVLVTHLDEHRHEENSG
ncbi:universal stress protein [Arthrobacter crystallopoietes]|uniref:universal stress protein n=1 Tax=Crystallibacter crystallopoietes TaxID=37928 RepID=UPI0011114724|nr:universal stress protein [Arthrobacter crystallopoietes]